MIHFKLITDLQQSINKMFFASPDYQGEEEDEEEEEEEEEDGEDGEDEEDEEQKGERVHKGGHDT